MEYDFKLPDGRSFAVQSWGNMAVELAAHLAGVKPVVHCWIQDTDQVYLDQLCKAFKLRSFVFDRQGQKMSVMLGKTRKELEEAAKVWTTPHSNPGPQLGYPPCCSDFYCTWLDDPSADTGPDVIELILNHTPQPHTGLPFLLNDAFYLYSRRGKAGDSERREALTALNRSLDMNVLNVIPWHPCSYRCEASLKAAKLILKTMETVSPSLAKTIKAHLPYPVVFRDWDRFAVLKGTSSAYQGLHAPFSPLVPEYDALLKSGDRVSVGLGRAVSVYSGKKKLGVIPDAILLDFGP